MEPRIQYARTVDGVNIAFWAHGQGLPLVEMPPFPWSHLQAEWQDPGFRSWYERLSEQHRLIRYDGRGSGLSDRQAPSWAPEAHHYDLAAVADKLGLERFALFGVSTSGSLAIAYAALHPEQVSHLVLWCASARRGELSASLQGLEGLLNTDWPLYTETIAHAMVAGWAAPEQARRFAAIMRDATDAATFRAMLEANLDFESTDLLPGVAQPTLVLHRRGARIPSPEAARGLAAAIPNARLALLEGDAILPFVGDMEAVARAIDEFLAEGGQDLPSGMTAILFADIAESTALTERLGDAAFRAKARDLDGALRTVIREHGGTAIEGKLLGDGVLAVFSSAAKAIEAACACKRAGNQARLPLHLGLHAGDVIREENNVYGGAVNLASRISGLSSAGEVLVSETVRSLARTSAGVRFEDRGEQSLRGVGEAVRVWAVREEE